MKRSQKNRLLLLSLLAWICLIVPSHAVEITYDTIYPEFADPYYVPVFIKELPFDGSLWDVQIQWNTNFLTVYQRDGNGYPITPKFMGTDYYDYDARNASLAAAEAIKAALLADGYTGKGIGTSGYMIIPYWDMLL